MEASKAPKNTSVSDYTAFASVWGDSSYMTLQNRVGKGTFFEFHSSDKKHNAKQIVEERSQKNNNNFFF